MHVNNHSVSLKSIHCSGDHYQSVLRNKIPNTSVPLWISSTRGFEVELQGRGEGKECKETAQCAQEQLRVCHGLVGVLWLKVLETGRVKGITFDVVFGEAGI